MGKMQIDHTQDSLAIDMYEAYQTGLSLQAVADRFAIDVSSVRKLFRHRGYKTRPTTWSKSKMMYKPVYWGGVKWTPRSKGGYLGCTSTKWDGPSLLHSAVWEKAHGPLPPNMKLTFIDGDRTNWKLQNLKAVQRTEYIGPANNAVTKGYEKREIPTKHCLACGREMKRRQFADGLERPATFLKRRTCSHACRWDLMKGRSSKTKRCKTTWDMVTPRRDDPALVAKLKFARNPAAAALIARPGALAATPPPEPPPRAVVAQEAAQPPATPEVEEVLADVEPTPPKPRHLCPKCTKNDLPEGMAICFECREAVMRPLRDSVESSKRTRGMGAV